jgi:hypothetical protein
MHYRSLAITGKTCSLKNYNFDRFVQSRALNHTVNLITENQWLCMLKAIVLYLQYIISPLRTSANSLCMGRNTFKKTPHDRSPQLRNEY